MNVSLPLTMRSGARVSVVCRLTTIVLGVAALGATDGDARVSQRHCPACAPSRRRPNIRTPLSELRWCFRACAHAWASRPAGASARCSDGSWSFSQHHRDTCSHHGGVAS